MFDGLLSKLTSCFSERQDETEHRNNLKSLTTNKIQGEKKPEHEKEPKKEIDVVYKTSKFQDVTSIRETLEEGIPLYYIARDTIGVHNIRLHMNSIEIVSVDEESKISNITSNLTNVVKLEEIEDVFVGPKTSTMLLIKEKVSIIPWRCFSLIVKGKPIDYITEYDDDLFHILLSLYRFQSGKDFSYDHDWKKRVCRLYWEKALLKIEVYLAEEGNKD